MYVSFYVALFTHTKRGYRYLMHISTQQPTSLLFKLWQSYRNCHSSLKSPKIEQKGKKGRRSGFSRPRGLGPEELLLRGISLMLIFKIFVVGGKCQLSSKPGFYSWLKVFFQSLRVEADCSPKLMSYFYLWKYGACTPVCTYIYVHGHLGSLCRRQN